MRKTFTTTIAALAAISSVVTAIPAGAQNRRHDSDRDGRSDRSEWNRDRDHDGRPDQWDRNDHRDRDRHNGWRDRRGRNWTYYGSNYGSMATMATGVLVSVIPIIGTSPTS